MSLVFQIVVLLVVLAGLIGTIMCIKNWHWAQMLLLLGIYFSALGTLLLGLEVYRIHRNLRAGVPKLEKQLAEVQEENAALRQGTRDPVVIARIANRQENGLPFDQEAEGRLPGFDVWEHRLQDANRARGRVWRGVVAGGPVDPKTGRVPVLIKKPSPHGLAKDAIVYAFEQGEPNAATPPRGAQYLGEFRVVESNAGGAVLEAILRLDDRTGPRLEQSAAGKKAWSLYETMPADQHELFAGKDEETLRKLLPAASVEQYIRQGTKAREDDDPHDVAGFDDQGRRLGPENIDKAVEKRFDRPLRDYAYLFSELAREKTLLLARAAALTEDNAKLKAANEAGIALGKKRAEETRLVTQDLGHMKNDRRVIEALQQTVQKQLANAKTLLGDALKYNLQLADELVDRQLSALRADGGSALPTGASEISVGPADF